MIWCHRLTDRTRDFQSRNRSSILRGTTMYPKDQIKYQKALALRYKGKSYGEIKKILNVPKSTQSNWFKNLKLPLSVQKILKEKGRVTRTQFIEFNRRRTQKIKAENQRIKKETFEKVNLLSKYELMLIGAVLYWAEGYKIEIQKKTPQICFANADPYMVALFIRFLKEVIQVSEEKFRVSVHIHPNIKDHSAIKFWSEVTNIPQERFRITRQISRASKRKRPWNSLPYGTLDLRVNNRKNSFQIQGLINGLKHQSSLN